MKIKDELAFLLKSSGLPYHVIAKDLETSKTQIIRLANGEVQNPKLDTVERVLRYLGYELTITKQQGVVGCTYSY